MLLSFGAKPWCDVPAAASNASQRRVARAAQARRRSLSLGRRRSTRACCARAPCRAGCGRPCPRKDTAPREASLLRRAPWCDVPAAASKPSQRRVSRARGALRSLSLGRRRSTRACCARAVPRWLWSLASYKGHCDGERPLSFGARRGATCQLRPPTPSQRRVSRGAGAPALAVSGEEAQHSSLLRVRAVPRWL